MVIAGVAAVPPTACALAAVISYIILVRSLYYITLFLICNLLSKLGNLAVTWSLMLQGIRGKLYIISFFIML